MRLFTPLLFSLGLSLAQTLEIPPANTPQVLYMSVFGHADLDTISLENSQLILEFSRERPHEFYGFEHWRYENGVLYIDGDLREVKAAESAVLESSLEQALELAQKETAYRGLGSAGRKWFFGVEGATFSSLALWQDADPMNSWFADPFIDGVAGYTQNDARIDTLLARHFVSHNLLTDLVVMDFASELPEYADTSQDIALGLVLMAESLNRDLAFEVWKEIVPYLGQPNQP